MSLPKRAVSEEPMSSMAIFVVMVVLLLSGSSSFATTKGLSQIVTPDLQGEGDLSLSLQIQDKRIANPYQLQAEMGLTKWAEVAVFRGFQPDEWIFGTEIGLLTKEPFLLSIGFVNWSPHLNVDPQPYIEAGYYTEHHKIIVGAIHADYKNEAILGYAYDLIRHGVCRSISRAAPKTHRQSVSPATSHEISSSIPQSISATTIRDAFSVISFSLTLFISGVAKKKTARRSQKRSGMLPSQNDVCKIGISAKPHQRWSADVPAEEP